MYTYSHYIFFFVPFMALIIYIYSNEKSFICYKCVCSHDAFIVKKVFICCKCIYY